MTDEQIPADIFTEGGEHGEHGLYIGLTDNPKDAAYIVALVDADRAVEQPPRKKRSENRQRRSMTAVRLLPDEHEQLRQAADQRGLTLSEFIRSAALTAASDPAVAS